VQNLLKNHKASSLRELSGILGISFDKIKNVSSGRTSFNSLYVERKQRRTESKHSKELAELIGIVLGDGNISKFSRCQRLVISCNSRHKKYIEHIRWLVEGIFNKKPSLIKRSKANCIDIYLYLQDIDKTLGMPSGNKIKNSVAIPEWIFREKGYLKKCLKGLFETDGHYGLNKKSYVEYIQFCNKCESLNRSVFRALRNLDYSPQVPGSSYVRLAKKVQVRRFIKEMVFQRPFPALMN